MAITLRVFGSYVVEGEDFLRLEKMGAAESSPLIFRKGVVLTRQQQPHPLSWPQPHPPLPV